MKPKCKLVETDQELNEVHSIRNTVFIKEQNVPPEIEWNDYEDSAIHYICKLDDKTVGTGRIVFFGLEAKIERVAVLKQYRNSGIGTYIMEFLINECKKRNATTIFAHVQMQAYGFYKKLGFQEFGDIFFEADIEHLKMFYKED